MQTKGFILALIAAIFWGVSGNCAQFLFQWRGVNTEWLVTVRMLVSGLTILVYAGTRKELRLWDIWADKRDVLSLVLFALLGLAAVQYTYFAAIRASNAATATVLQYTGPVMIAVYLAARNRTWPTLSTSLAILAATLGTFLLVTHGSFHTLSISGAALFWGLASAVTMAFYNIQPEGLLRRYNTFVVIGWAQVIGGLVFTAVHPPWVLSGSWDVWTWLNLGGVVVLGSLLAFTLYMASVKWVGAQIASLLTCVEPVAAALIAVWWLGVPFFMVDWVGTVCILATVFLLAQPTST